MTIYATTSIHECRDEPITAIVKVVDIVPRQNKEPLFVIEFGNERYLRSAANLKFFPNHQKGFIDEAQPKTRRPVPHDVLPPADRRESASAD